MGHTVATDPAAPDAVAEGNPLGADTAIETVDRRLPSRMRQSAVQFPLMIVVSIAYPCNFGCPNCPYSDGNSTIRSFYHERRGDYFPEELWNRIAEEAGRFSSWLRCTGGGEPMMHPRMVPMIEFAKSRGARVWLNTNGSLFGPGEGRRQDLHRIVSSGVDIIEFSMDAGDADTYAAVRPPLAGRPRDAERRWQQQVANVQAALAIRKALRSPTRIVVSMIRQRALDGRLEQAQEFWANEIGVDDVITRKFLNWDDNTAIDLADALDVDLYPADWQKPAGPCVWPFERLNVDTLGRVALCGQDISFRTSELFPSLWESTVQEVWHGKAFTEYRRLHMAGKGDTVFPCRGCSAWHAGVRDWHFGWIQVLEKSAESVRTLFRQDLGYEVEIHTPEP